MNMRLGAIITGDIVNSTNIPIESRDLMLNILQAIPEKLAPISDVSFEIFRGDGFQIGVLQVDEAVRCALAVRAWLRSNKPIDSNNILDARIAIGIGTLDYESDSLSTSDGEAYRLSGRLLDEMNKSRFKIMTSWKEVNEELGLATLFVDDIVSGWTQSQSEIILAHLQTPVSHIELAKKLNLSRQMVDKSLKASKKELIDTYDQRFKKLINKHLQ